MAFAQYSSCVASVRRQAVSHQTSDPEVPTNLKRLAHQATQAISKVLWNNTNVVKDSDWAY